MATIESIDKGGDVNVDESYGEVHDLIAEHQINFIPLTEEWINKFGFVTSILGMELQIERGEDCDFEGVLLSYESSGLFIYPDGEGRLFMPKIKFVHQLQNLYFALTGEELATK